MLRLQDVSGTSRVQFTPDDLVKPNPHQIQMVFECFAELLMNATRETIEPAMSAAAKDVCEEYAGIFQSDARNVMGFFYITLRKLLIKVRTGSNELFRALISSSAVSTTSPSRTLRNQLMIVLSPYFPILSTLFVFASHKRPSLTNTLAKQKGPKRVLILSARRAIT